MVKKKSYQELSAELHELRKNYEALKNSFDCQIQKRISTETTLLRSENRYNNLSEQIDAIVWHYDLKNDRWGYVSPQTERILGYTPDEWINFQWWVDIMHPDDRTWAPSFCLNETKRGAWHEFEYRLRHKNGQYIWIYDKVRVETLDGEPVALLGAMFDVSRHKLEEINNRDFASKKLKTAIENVKASILITDSDGNIEFANPFFSELTGYAADELKGKTPGILKSGVQDQPFYEKLWEVIKTGNTWRGEMCNKKKNGELFWEFATISPFKNEAGAITNFVGVKTDITPVKELNNQLQIAKDEAEESKLRFEALHNASFGGIAIHDNGIILDCNKGLAEMTEYSVDEIIGMNGLLLFHENSRDMVISNIRAGYNKAYETIGIRKSGEEYPLRIEGRNVPYKGKTARVVEFRDISERKRNEGIIIKQNETLKSLVADKDRFISILAHDLKGSLGGMIGLTQLMAQNGGEYGAEKITYLSNTLYKATQNAYNLLNDLLAWARSQSGNMAFKPTDVSLSEVSGEVKKEVTFAALSKSIELKFDIDSGLSVFADRYMLRTILRNLISNGIKFTNPGGSVSINAIQEPDGIVVKVSDTGTGITAEKTRVMFNGSYNQSETGTDKEHGNGFGLLLCKEFVQKHSGSIWVESKVGEGSDFYFKLPCNQ